MARGVGDYNYVVGDNDTYNIRVGTTAVERTRATDKDSANNTIDKDNL